MAAVDDICQRLELQIGEKYSVIKKLGQGSFGQVLLAQDKKSGDSVALKLVRKDRTKCRVFLTEVKISFNLSTCKEIITTYPNIINTMEYYILTQELAPAGTLHSIIEPDVGIAEAKAKRCAEQLANALHYMHTRNLVHRDLKPDNVLLMDEECHQIKLSDFGLSQKVGHLISATSRISPYLPPELYSIQKPESLPLHPCLDSWALGILLYYALSGWYPWKVATLHDIDYTIYTNWHKSEQCDSHPIQWWFFTHEGVRMFSRLLAPHPSLRAYSGIIFEYLSLPWSV